MQLIPIVKPSQLFHTIIVVMQPLQIKEFTKDNTTVRYYSFTESFESPVFKSSLLIGVSVALLFSTIRL